jgi:hypothetical protein
MAVISAIWWVLGWYPIFSSLIGAAVVGTRVVVPDGWVQPAVSSKRAMAIRVIAVILIGFMSECCTVNNKKVFNTDNISPFLYQKFPLNSLKIHNNMYNCPHMPDCPIGISGQKEKIFKKLT